MRRVLAYTLLVLASLVVIVPFLLVLLASINPAGLPEPTATPTVAHYLRLLANPRYARALLNSIIVATGATLLSVFISATAGYALSRFDFRGKGILMAVILGVFMIPITVNTIPLYLMLQRIGWLDSYQGLIVPYQALILPLNVWILKNFFDTIPRELEEAAMMDGASRWQVFRIIILPLVWPGIAVAVIFAARFSWNEFVFAATFTSSPSMQTWQAALYNFLGATGSDWGPLTAGVVIGAVPVVLLYSVFQRQFVSGLTLGGVKA
jgi:multiple sugar transport system permease protein